MTEPKRWTPTRYDGVAMAPSTRGRYVNGLDYDALAADFDRLRDERDRLDYLWNLEADRARKAESELGDVNYDYVKLRNAAGVLADALRELHAEVTRFQPGESAGVRLQSRGPSFAAAEALAVFDTLTEEKT